jgi:hypothetical protein
MSLLPLCGCEPEEPEPVENLAPAAALTLPERWPVTEPVPVDASGSIDLDGVLADVRVSFGDGSDEQSRLDGLFAHAYPAAGAYEVRLLVIDEDGATDEVSADVIIVDRVDDPRCDCDLGCQAETSTCTEEGCFGQHLSERAADNDVEAAETPTPLSCP